MGMESEVRMCLSEHSKMVGKDFHFVLNWNFRSNLSWQTDTSVSKKCQVDVKSKRCDFVSEYPVRFKHMMSICQSVTYFLSNLLTSVEQNAQTELISSHFSARPTGWHQSFGCWTRSDSRLLEASSLPERHHHQIHHPCLGYVFSWGKYKHYLMKIEINFCEENCVILASASLFGGLVPSPLSSLNGVPLGISKNLSFRTLSSLIRCLETRIHLRKNRKHIHFWVHRKILLTLKNTVVFIQRNFQFCFILTGWSKNHRGSTHLSHPHSEGSTTEP